MKYPMITKENRELFHKWLLETETGQEVDDIISRAKLPKTMRAVVEVAFCSAIEIFREQENPS